ncbi:MAG: cyclic nucleotide-binding domain-containing protein [Cystobacterineae bacterium]|nr:cyclic nucleotide-binding domain-containing protein [Cystobacterineae bacterium]
MSILRKVALFEGLTSRQLNTLKRVLKAREYAAGAGIFSEGEKGDSMFIIAEGKVRLSQMIDGVGEEAIALMNTGQHFGEMALIDDSPRAFFAIAHSPCVLYELNNHAFNELMFMHKEIAYTLLWTLLRSLAQRLRETNERMRSFLTMASFATHGETASPFGPNNPLASLNEPLVSLNEPLGAPPHPEGGHDEKTPTPPPA